MQTQAEQDNAWTVDGVYYANAADADFWRRLRDERRERDRVRLANARQAVAA